MGTRDIETTSIGGVIKIGNLALAGHSRRGQSQFFREIAEGLLTRPSLARWGPSTVDVAQISADFIEDEPADRDHLQALCSNSPR